MDAAGGIPTQVTGSPSNRGDVERGPAWSPDGERIAFTTTRTLNYRIWSINPDGTGSTQLTTDVGPGAYDFDSDWQPIPPPLREAYKNGAQFCRAERDFLGEEAFRQRYGGGANAHGRCVSGSN